MNNEPCRECKYGNCYNEDWCECHHPMIRGSKVQIKCGCIVELWKKFNKTDEGLTMIYVDCPYCGRDVNILFGEEIRNLIRKGISDCQCDYCNKIFDIYQGNMQYETRKKQTGEKE